MITTPDYLKQLALTSLGLGFLMGAVVTVLLMRMPV